MNHDRKLEHWAERELKHNLNDLILDDDDGSILAFGRYHIKPCGNCCEVYRDQDLVGSFSNRKIALSWCVLEHRGFVDQSQHLTALDQRSSALGNDITNSIRSSQGTKNNDFRAVLAAKIQNKQLFQRRCEIELEKYVARAKYLQLRGFRNETARTRDA